MLWSYNFSVLAQHRAFFHSVTELFKLSDVLCQEAIVTLISRTEMRNVKIRQSVKYAIEAWHILALKHSINGLKTILPQKMKNMKGIRFQVRDAFVG